MELRGPTRNTMSEILLEILRSGGVRNFGVGFAKRGVRTNPPNPPPGYGPAEDVDVKKKN